MKSLAALLWKPLRAGMNRVKGRDHHAGKVTILCYHRIVADIAHAERETEVGMVTSVETFRRQMELVREHCEVLTLDEAAAVLRGERSITRTAAVITFDDGYRDFYDLAWPVLRELGLPATVFVPTAYIGSGQMLDHDRFYLYVMKARSRGLSLRVPLVKAGLSAEKVAALCAEVNPLRIYSQLSYLPFALRERSLRCLDDFVGDQQEENLNGFSLLDWEMAREMSRAGIFFGAHTDNHVVLTNEEPQTVEREILRSKQALEERLGRPVRHFAYPTGKYNVAVKDAVARAGFEVAVTTERRLNRRGDDLLALGRICLCEESTRGASGRYSEDVARLRLAV
ncbi:MAG: polysaccharide deacetylase family protein [Blastocatellia bacterium]